MAKIDGYKGRSQHGVGLISPILLSPKLLISFNSLYISISTVPFDISRLSLWDIIILTSLRLRLKKPWIRQESNESVRDAKWILFLALPQLDDSGNLTKVLGCTTDISGFKFAEHVQMLSRLQAEEAKRQQESFIDMTS